MHEETWHIELRCTGCRLVTMHDPAGVVRWLSAAGRLHSRSEATRDELRELALALAPQVACTACGEVRLTARLVEDDPDDWPEARRCEECGQLIPPERLEIFPQMTLCTACQGRDERGELSGAPEYCPACGTPMVVRLSRGAGIRRYALECTNCRK